MKILFVSLHYAPELTGNAPYVASLAGALAARGHSVEVITTHPHYPEWRIRPGYGQWSSTEELPAGVQVSRLRHFVPSRPNTLTRTLAEVSFGARALGRRWPEADVVILLSPGLLSSRMVRGRATRKARTFVWMQDIYTLGMRETGQGNGLFRTLMHRIEAGTVAEPVRVMAIHQRFSDFIHEHLGVERERIDVVRNWTHLAESGDLTPREQVRQRLGWAPDEMIVLHAGNQGVKQGLENVVDAARLADEQSSRTRFVLLGHGNQHAGLRAAAEGVSRIQFVEPLPDREYQETMLAADVLLVNESPGVSEMSVPSKLTSYFSTGLPVLGATDQGGVTAEEIRSSEAGLCVPPADPKAMLDAVERLRAMPDRGASVGSAGPRYVAQVLSMEAAVDRVESLFGVTRKPVSAPAGV